MKEIFANAIASVLKRKRAERLDIETKLAAASVRHEKPKKGLGSDLVAVESEIKRLEEAAGVLMKEEP